jgi:hypothetical protein
LLFLILAEAQGTSSFALTSTVIVINQLLNILPEHAFHKNSFLGKPAQEYC